jgi:hypothetical protein
MFLSEHTREVEDLEGEKRHWFKNTLKGHSMVKKEDKSLPFGSMLLVISLSIGKNSAIYMDEKVKINTIPIGQLSL